MHIQPDRIRDRYERCVYAFNAVGSVLTTKQKHEAGFMQIILHMLRLVRLFSRGRTNRGLRYIIDSP